MDSNERETETEGDLGEGCERASERGGGSGDVRGLERQEERNRQREREKGRERERERERVVKDTCRSLLTLIFDPQALAEQQLDLLKKVSRSLLTLK